MYGVKGVICLKIRKRIIFYMQMNGGDAAWEAVGEQKQEMEKKHEKRNCHCS